MSRRMLIPLSIAAVLVAALVAIPSGSAKSGKTETLRLFDKQTSLTVKHADGTTTSKPPYAEPKAGDTLIATSLDYAGNHKKHSKKPIGSAYLTCKFVAEGPPTCVSSVAIAGSLLMFEGDPGTVAGAAGKYEGATGRVLSNKTIGDTNDSDVVVKLKLK